MTYSCHFLIEIHLIVLLTVQDSDIEQSGYLDIDIKRFLCQQ